MSSKQELLVGHTSLKNHQTQPKKGLAFRVQYRGQPPKRPLRCSMPSPRGSPWHLSILRVWP